MIKRMAMPDGAQKKQVILSLLMGVGLMGVLTLSGMMDRLSQPAGWKLGALFSVMMTGVLLGCTRAAKGSMRRYGWLAGLSLAALVARLTFLETVTSDYQSFLAEWVTIFRQGGFKMLTAEIGDYNLPYQYILSIIARSDIHDMYLIKLVSIAFDFALALVMYQMTERFIDRRFSLVVYAGVLFSPTVMINGAYWAQCDTLYVFFVVASLYLMLRDRPVISVVCMAVAFSFKLQTIFFFPMALFGLLHKKYKLRHALVFPLTYLATLVPALLLGRSLSSALMVYVNQSVGQYFDRLTYNAGNIYQFFPIIRIGDDSGSRYFTTLFPELTEATETFLSEANMKELQSAALIFCIVIVLAITLYVIVNRKHLKLDQVWGVAFFSALFLPFVMPKMHDRYFMMAEMFALLYAARHPKRWWMPACVTASSFICYAPIIMRQRVIPTQMALILNLAAVIGVARDVFGSMQAHAACEEAKG